MLNILLKQNILAALTIPDVQNKGTAPRLFLLKYSKTLHYYFKVGFISLKLISIVEVL